MLISFGYDISLRLEVETPVLFCLRVHPSRREDIVCGENFQIEPQNAFEEYLNGFGNICGRVHCKPGIIRFVNQGIIRDSGQLDAYEPSAAGHEIFNLPQETLVYLDQAAIVKLIANSRILRGRISVRHHQDGCGCRQFATLFTGIFGSTIRKHERRALRSTLSESGSGSAGTSHTSRLLFAAA